MAQVVLGGILPFGACFVELFFILSSMWMDQYYYVFGFTLLVFVILLVTCAEVTVVLVYFQVQTDFIPDSLNASHPRFAIGSHPTARVSINDHPASCFHLELIINTSLHQLCAEDYHWWWKCFLASGSTAM